MQDFTPISLKCLLLNYVHREVLDCTKLPLPKSLIRELDMIHPVPGHYQLINIYLCSYERSDGQHIGRSLGLVAHLNKMIGKMVRVKLEEGASIQDRPKLTFSSHFEQGILYTIRSKSQRIIMPDGEQRRLIDQSRITSRLESANCLVQNISHEFHRLVEDEVITIKFSLVWWGVRVSKVDGG